MRYASIRKMDTSNGNGVHTSIFVQGCYHRCEGCWNESTWDFNGGKEFTEELLNKFIECSNADYITGISILGGEPFQQNPSEILGLLKTLKDRVGKPIWLWTGYEFGSIPNEYKECLDYIDVLIDGKYMEELRDLNLVLRGSSNQVQYVKENGVWMKKFGEMS